MQLINQLSSREAMRLPASYYASRLENTTIIFEKLRTAAPQQLIEIISSMQSSLEERWVAGTLLALIDDPRIQPFAPEMITISAGAAPIGTPEEDIEDLCAKYQSIGVKKEWLLKECPRHIVELSSFKIMKYPVTQKEYLLFLKETGHEDIPTSWRFGFYDPTKANHPIHDIKAESTDLYADWLSKKTGRSFRLPTEYEWEYAAAGLEGTQYPWGNAFFVDYANTLELGLYTTTPVGMFPQGASSFGCLDMAGNVEEFVATDYHPYPGGLHVIDDLGSQYRVARGGSFTRFNDLARCARRHGHYAKDIYVIGFRLVEGLS